MQVELLEVTTSDGVRLHGALLPPTADGTLNLEFDAILLLHGTGSNFYSAQLLRTLAEQAARWGMAGLRVNTRGHDGMSAAVVTDPASGQQARRLFGAAYEQVDQCRHDVAAWLDLLVRRGYRRVVLAGHSLGAVKAIYATACEPHPVLAALVAVSPPRLSYSHFAASPRAAGFLADVAAAEAHVGAGRPETLMEVRFPLPYVVTAAGFLDKYGPEERFNLLRLIDRVSCPMLFTYGGQEVEQSVAFRELPAALAAAAARDGLDLTVAVVAGGDHIYTGVYAALFDRIETWLVRQRRSGG